MTKSLRPGKVLVDWSQNNAAKTTVSVYSLRARPTATVSTPVTWDEVGRAAGGAPLSFTQADVLARIADGDLFEPLLATRPASPRPDRSRATARVARAAGRLGRTAQSLPSGRSVPETESL